MSRQFKDISRLRQVGTGDGLPPTLGTESGLHLSSFLPHTPSHPPGIPPLARCSCEEPSCPFSAHSGYCDPPAGRRPLKRTGGKRKERSCKDRTSKCPPCHNWRETGRQLTLGDSWGKEGWLTRPRCPGPGSGTRLVPAPARPGAPQSCLLCGSSLLAQLLSDADRAHHHAGRSQRVAGALEVVPADAVELAQVAADWVVDAVEV